MLCAEVWDGGLSSGSFGFRVSVMSSLFILLCFSCTLFFLFIELFGVTLVNKIIQISGAQLCTICYTAPGAPLCSALHQTSALFLVASAPV